MEKKKNPLMPDWEQIVQSIYQNIVWILFLLLVSWLGVRFDLLELKDKMNSIFSIPLYLLMALGAIIVLREVWRLFRKTKILSKNKEGDFVIYEGLTLKEASRESRFGYLARVGAMLEDGEIKYWAFVGNADRSVYECIVELKNLECRGEHSSYEWIGIDFDRKALKWDDAYQPVQGKIDISTDSERKIEIAVAAKMGGWKVSHLDGYSTNRHMLTVEYRLTLRIDGKLLVGDVKKPIKPLKYSVTFKYRGLSLDNMKIVKLVE